MGPIARRKAGCVVTGAAALSGAIAAGCAAMPGEGDGTATDQSLSSCSLAVTRNVYDGPNYWGTIAIKNENSVSVRGYSVQFRVPSGAHCTNDAVPSGAILSPLVGSGTSAATTSNMCTFTWSSAALAPGASKTFNYSTDSTGFSAASDVVAAGAGCSGGTTGSSGSSSGAPSSGSTSSSGSSTGSSSGSSSSSGGAGSLDPKVAPGGNFDLSRWELQEPVGSSGSPATFSPALLVGPNGHQDAYFHTDSTDGSMTFWDPENGVTTTNSSYPRSELREMAASGGPANWSSAGTHTLSATLKVASVPDHVCVGQIHVGSGSPSSTKPLLELFYYANGSIFLAIEQNPTVSHEVKYAVGNVPLGTRWSYVIGLSGNTISLSLEGGLARTWTMPSAFDQEGMYFKAGNYDQSVGGGSASATVQFYALTVAHVP